MNIRPLLLAPLIALAVFASSTSANAGTFLVCGSRDSFAVSAKPADCFLGWPDLPLAEAIGLRHARWSTWGGPRATARARFKVKDYDDWTNVRVTAMGRRTCAGGARLYTRVRVSFPSGSRHTWATPKKCADLPGDD